MVFAALPGVSQCYPDSVDVVLEASGSASVVDEGLRLLRPGGVYLFVGMVHPDTALNITGEQIIRKCLTIKGINFPYNSRPIFGVRAIIWLLP